MRVRMTYGALVDLVTIVVFGLVIALAACGIAKAQTTYHIFEWNDVPEADYYWVYYSSNLDDWTCQRRYQVLAEPPYCDGVTCTDLGETEEHIFSLGRDWKYVTVQSVNAAGESWDRPSQPWGCE